jgi:hypothetical protein
MLSASGQEGNSAERPVTSRKAAPTAGRTEAADPAPVPLEGSRPRSGDIEVEIVPSSGTKPTADQKTEKTDRTKPAVAKTGAKSGASDSKSKAARPVGPPVLEARLCEGGTLNLTLMDEHLEFITPYGRLTIPLSDVQRIDFSTRVSQDVADRIEKAIRDLGDDEFTVREKASAELLALKERAYPALVKAAESADPEVAHRAEELLEKLRELVPEDRLTPRENDVIQTKDSKFTGKLIGESLRVRTAQFGDQRLKFADVLSVKYPTARATSTASKNVLPDPGTLHAHQASIGQTLTFKVTGNPGGSIWGTDMYTLDTRLATAAVHAGVLKVGETGDVRLQILGPQPAFTGSARHGITSSDYGAYPGAYRILSAKMK